MNQLPSSQNSVQITDTIVGHGTDAQKGALVLIEFVGKLEDNTVFDSTERHGRPYQCVVGSKKIIQGLSLGLIGMREGGTRTIEIPAVLAYGDRQIGLIPPHSKLIFLVKLLESRHRE